MKIERRVGRVERTLLGGDEEPVTFDLGNGEQWRGTMREFSEILREVEGSRHYPGGLPNHEA